MYQEQDAWSAEDEEGFQLFVLWSFQSSHILIISHNNSRALQPITEVNDAFKERMTKKMCHLILETTIRLTEQSEQMEGETRAVFAFLYDSSIHQAYLVKRLQFVGGVSWFSCNNDVHRKEASRLPT